MAVHTDIGNGLAGYRSVKNVKREEKGKKEFRAEV